MAVDRRPAARPRGPGYPAHQQGPPAEREELRPLLGAMGLPADLTDGLNVQG